MKTEDEMIAENQATYAAKMPPVVFRQPEAEYHDTQLVIPDGTTIEEWVALGKHLRQCQKAANFWVADHRRFGRNSFDYDELADGLLQIEFNLEDEPEIEALAAYEGPRFSALTPEHHFVVSTLKKEEDQRFWLEKAEAEKMSVKGLMKAVAMASQPPAEQAISGSMRIASPQGIAMQFGLWQRQMPDNGLHKMSKEDLKKIEQIFRPLSHFLSVVRELLED